MTVSEKQDGVWMHRITYYGADPTEWRVGKATAYIKNGNNRVEECLFAPLSPSPISADAVVEACAAYHDDLAEQHAASHEHVVSDFHEMMEKRHREDAKAIRALKGTFPAVDWWRDIADAPKNTKVIAAYKNRLGNWRIVTACYHTQLAWSDDEDREGDSEYAPEGWYEESDSSETIYLCSHPPTHWQPLPAAPSTQEADHDNG